jgi:4-diphosphocytidyl-2-C-methyl-D-erythritol kinase
MRVARVAAQAKVNLWLAVGASDSLSGYHEIATLFHRIDLADEIVVRAGGSVRAIECAGPQLPESGLGPAEKNLAFRAALAYADRAGWPRGFSVELTKHIPVGGGLGGGSADAAAVLRALDALAPRPLETQVTQELAGSLGADVPFLASDHVAALAGGLGERLRGIKPLISRDVLLLVPDFAVSTGDAYRWLDRSRNGEQRIPWFQPDPPISWDTVEQTTLNDFEGVVESVHPDLGKLRERLSALGARVARLAGSGSCVFGVFDGPAPDPRELAVGALVIPTRTSSRVVQVEVLE